MSENIYKIELRSESESFYFLPRPEHFEALFYLTSLAHEYTLPSHYIERHDTDVYTLHFTARGEGRFIYDGISHTLKEGTLLFAYLGVHNVLFPVSEDFEYYSFHIHGANIKNLYRCATDNGKKIELHYTKERIVPLFENLKEKLDAPIDFFEISKALNGFLTDVLRLSVSEVSTMSPLIHEVYKLIVNNNTSAEEIARRLGYNSGYLERLFKKETGESIRTMIVRRKLEQAQNLLLTTSLSVGDIARRLGYADTVGLIHLFRRYLDCTPLEFRKRSRLSN